MLSKRSFGGYINRLISPEIFTGIGDRSTKQREGNLGKRNSKRTHRVTRYGWCRCGRHRSAPKTYIAFLFTVKRGRRHRASAIHQESKSSSVQRRPSV